MKHAGEYDESDLCRLIRVGRWLCMSGAAIGAIGLLGHLVGAAFLTTLVPGLPPMSRVTAFALVLVGVAGAVSAATPRRAGVRVIPLLLAFIVLIVGLATLALFAVGIEAPTVRALSAGPTTSSDWIPAPLTALALTCLALGLLLPDGSPTASVRSNLSEWLVLCAALVAYTALAGILLGAAPLYRLSRAPAIGLSLPTAIGLLTICTGVLLQRPGTGLMGMATSPGPGGVLVRRLFVPTIVAPVVVGLIVEQALAAMRTDDPALAVAIMGAAMAVLTLFMLFLTAGPLNRAHGQLVMSRLQNRALVDQAPDGIFIADIDGRYTDVNEAGCRMLGYTREEILAKSILDLIPAEETERLWRERGLMLEGAVHTSEWTLRRRNGSYLPVAVSARILPDGRWQGFVRDVSERKRAEREQQFLADIWPALTTTLDYEETQSRVAGIAVRDLADLCIVHLCDELDGEQRARIAVREPAHASIRDVLQEMVRDLDRSPLGTTASTTPFLVERPYPAAWARIDDRVRALGEFALQSVIVAPLVAHDKLLGTISLLSVTPGKLYGPHDLRLAGEIAQRSALAVNNAQLYHAARRAIQIRDDVLGIVAHDLRNPLSVILAKSRPVHRRNGSGSLGEAEGLSDGIYRSAIRMNRLIQDLLDVTRFEAGQLDLERRRLPVRDVLNEVFTLQGELASSASLQLRFELPAQVPDVWADADRLLQALENLVANAIKFTPTGGDIAVGATAWNTTVLFWVRDTGCGIAFDDQPHLFDRFWQARMANRAGSGLGLAIVKSIVEAHGGQVWVESAPGRGSTFFFNIPAESETSGTWSTASVSLSAQVDAMNAEPGPAGALCRSEGRSGEVCDDLDRPVSTPSAPRPRVILADDYQGILSAFRRLLSPSCDVLATVTNGADLVAAAAKFQPDAILMDLFMGTSLADRCRALQRVVPRAKVVIMTAADDARIEREAVREGAAAVVSKAQAADDLVLTILRVVAPARRHGRVVGAK